jgi:hypothetical protein
MSAGTLLLRWGPDPPVAASLSNSAATSLTASASDGIGIGSSSGGQNREGQDADESSVHSIAAAASTSWDEPEINSPLKSAGGGGCGGCAKR